MAPKPKSVVPRRKKAEEQKPGLDGRVSTVQAEPETTFDERTVVKTPHEQVVEDKE